MFSFPLLARLVASLIFIIAGLLPGCAHAATDRWCGYVVTHWLPEQWPNCASSPGAVFSNALQYANAKFSEGVWFPNNDGVFKLSAFTTSLPGKKASCEVQTDGNYPIIVCAFNIHTVITNNWTGAVTESDGQGLYRIAESCDPRKNLWWDESRQACLSTGESEKPECETCRVGDGALSPTSGMLSSTVPIFEWGSGQTFSLSYNNTRRGENSVVQYMLTPSAGFSWFSSLHRSYLYNHLGSEGLGQIYLRGDGAVRTFRDQGNSGMGLSSAVDVDPVPLQANGYIYRDTKAGALEVYQPAASGFIYEGYDVKDIYYIDGRRLTYTIGVEMMGAFPARTIQGVEDENGRRVNFGYDKASGPDGLDFRPVLVSTLGPDGAKTKFTYAASDLLAGIEFPDGSKRSFEYGPYGLTAEIDEEGVAYKSYGYDSEGRANMARIGTSMAWSVSWPTPPSKPKAMGYDAVSGLATREHRFNGNVVATIQKPDGSTETRQGVSIDGSMLTSQIARSAGAAFGPSTVQIERDGGGNVVRRVDENGTQTCFAYDEGRHLETIRIEGLRAEDTCSTALSATASLPAGARKITTTWHPDWRKAVQVASPLRRETLVYNGQPDPFAGGAIASCAPSTAILPDNKPIVVLCKRVEETTTDESGVLGLSAPLKAGVAARSIKWTYNATGRVLTETNARGTVVTTNEYYTDATADHMRGDLKSSINVAGHVTNYPRYNAYGKPLEIIDPNGISTTYSYDLRLRLTSITTLDATTAYAYRLNGLLDRVTAPDGTETRYEYDDARRLKAVSDSKGNRIEYTLDASGNRTAEQAKDPQGTLKRTISRFYDALGRAEQTTGRE